MLSAKSSPRLEIPHLLLHFESHRAGWCLCSGEEQSGCHYSAGPGFRDAGICICLLHIVSFSFEMQNSLSSLTSVSAGPLLPEFTNYRGHCPSRNLDRDLRFREPGIAVLHNMLLARL